MRIEPDTEPIPIPGQLAPILGPVLGGTILSAHGWRWIFYINLPISLVALALAWWGLPISPRPRASAFDWVGFAFLSPGLAALVYGLSLAGTSGSFLALPALPWLGAGALLVAGFIATALRKGDSALIDLGLMRQRSFAAVSCLTFLFGIAIYGPMFSLPLYFQWVWGDQALSAGVMLAPQGIGTMLAIAFAGRWSDRAGPRPVVLAGMSVTALATLAFILDIGTSRWLLALSLFIRGVGLGAAGIPVMAAAYHGLKAPKIPRATGGVNVMQRLGASFGTALLAIIVQRRLSTVTMGNSPVDAVHITNAFHIAFMWTLVFALVALIPALMLPRYVRATER